jgi:Flp pilus assembly pilin Flp
VSYVSVFLAHGPERFLRRKNSTGTSSLYRGLHEIRRIGRAWSVELGRVKDGASMTHLLRKVWRHDEGQDIAEYAVMLAVILVIVVGTIRLVGSNANNVFSAAASSIQ